VTKQHNMNNQMKKKFKTKSFPPNEMITLCPRYNAPWGFHTPSWILCDFDLYTPVTRDVFFTPIPRAHQTLNLDARTLSFPASSTTLSSCKVPRTLADVRYSWCSGFFPAILNW